MNKWGTSAKAQFERIFQKTKQRYDSQQKYAAAKIDAEVREDAKRWLRGQQGHYNNMLWYPYNHFLTMVANYQPPHPASLGEVFKVLGNAQQELPGRGLDHIIRALKESI